VETIEEDTIMASLKNYYMEYAERGLFPLEDGTTTTIYNLIEWLNDPAAEPPAPDDAAAFLDFFVPGVERCNDCGRHGYSHYFVNTGSETLCVDCG